MIDKVKQSNDLIYLPQTATIIYDTANFSLWLKLVCLINFNRQMATVFAIILLFSGS